MLAVNDAAAAIEFYKAAFGAIEEGERFMWEGKVGHAEIRIAETGVKIADEFPGENQSPTQLGGTSVILHLDVEDTDASFHKAVKAGAEVLRAPEDFFYGASARFAILSAMCGCCMGLRRIRNSSVIASR